VEQKRGRSQIKKIEDAKERRGCWDVSGEDSTAELLGFAMRGMAAGLADERD